jgi:hypothetical protein
LHKRFECPSVVNVQGCQGVMHAKRCALLQGSQQWGGCERSNENSVRGGVGYVVGVGAE